MFNRLRGIILGLSVLVFCFPAYGNEISREKIKGLDEQVQEIKSDVLDIAEELNQLEEKLLYPSNTQVAVFVSLVSGETFLLDSVEIKLDGKPVAHHIYTFKELEALQKGGFSESIPEISWSATMICWFLSWVSLWEGAISRKLSVSRSIRTWAPRS
jgi:hypothetical protein